MIEDFQKSEPANKQHTNHSIIATNSLRYKVIAVSLYDQLDYTPAIGDFNPN